MDMQTKVTFPSQTNYTQALETQVTLNQLWRIKTLKRWSLEQQIMWYWFIIVVYSDTGKIFVLYTIQANHSYMSISGSAKEKIN